MPKLHDGDLHKISTVPEVYAEFLLSKNTGKMGFRLTDSLARGVCIEREGMEVLLALLAQALEENSLTPVTTSDINEHMAM